jgi:hypothetical protein
MNACSQFLGNDQAEVIDSSGVSTERINIIAFAENRWLRRSGRRHRPGSTLVLLIARFDLVAKEASR